VAALVVIGGCNTIHVEAPVIPPPLTNKIPLTIGVHYSPEFRSASPETRGVTYLAGPASVQLFDTVLRAIFSEVVEVSEWPPTGSKRAVAGVLVPTLSSLAPIDGKGARAEFQVELFTPTGERIGAWQVVGTQPSPEWLTALMRDTLRGAGGALIASFFREPDARAWLTAHGVSPDSWGQDVNSR
jgi:hypothetical protein